jgi:hypothetical protein
MKFDAISAKLRAALQEQLEAKAQYKMWCQLDSGPLDKIWASLMQFSETEDDNLIVMQLDEDISDNDV